MRLPPCLAMLSVACSTTPAITVAATPDRVPGDGITSVTVTAKPAEGGSPVDALVHFPVEVQGGIPGQPTAVAWDGAGGLSTRVDVSASSGVATATLKAPRQGFGALRFTATFSSQGHEPAATTSVSLAPAGGAAKTLAFTCQHRNVGALVHGRLGDIHVLCRATAVDAAGHSIANASVQTLSEAGHLQWLDDDQGAQEFVYSVRPDDPPPKDVGPLDGRGREVQACRQGATPIPSGRRARRGSRAGSMRRA